jgi:hypothetical protein
MAAANSGRLQGPVFRFMEPTRSAYPVSIHEILIRWIRIGSSPYHESRRQLVLSQSPVLGKAKAVPTPYPPPRASHQGRHVMDLYGLFDKIVGLWRGRGSQGIRSGSAYPPHVGAIDGATPALPPHVGAIDGATPRFTPTCGIRHQVGLSAWSLAPSSTENGWRPLKGSVANFRV